MGKGRTARGGLLWLQNRANGAHRWRRSREIARGDARICPRVDPRALTACGLITAARSPGSEITDRLVGKGFLRGFDRRSFGPRSRARASARGSATSG